MKKILSILSKDPSEPSRSHETSPAPCSPSPRTHARVSNQPQCPRPPGPSPAHRATRSSGLLYTNRDCQRNPYTTPNPRKSRDDPTGAPEGSPSRESSAHPSHFPPKTRTQVHQTDQPHHP